ncbi:MAG: GNAT family N-acetyltransferase [Methanomicrobiales archaeon]
MLKIEDIQIIKSSPQYPPEFAELDYALRDGGWLDHYSTKTGTEIMIAEDRDELIGFSILSKEEGGSAEFRIAIHPDKLGMGLGKTLATLTLIQGFSSTDFPNMADRSKKQSPCKKII